MSTEQKGKKGYKRERTMYKRRIVSVLLAGALTAGMGLQVNMQVQADDLQDAQNKASQQQDQIDAAQAEKDKLLEELDGIVSDMEKTKKDIEAKQEEISKKADELDAARIDENNQYNSMKLRIQYMYENGNGQFIETLLESQSIAEFLSNAEYISQISEYDRNMLVEFQNIVAQVEDQQEELEAENAELEKLQTDLQDQQAELEGLISSKSEEIAGLESELSETNAKIAELKAAAEEQARLQREAAALQNSTNSGSGSGSGTGGTGGGGGNYTQGPSYTAPSGGGVLQNPCPSAYISSEFGGRQSPGGIGSTNHKGRDYAAASGTPIYAAASGTVTTVAFQSARGYYVVINHGNGLSTLYQHCSAIYVSQGQSVSAGTNIAAVGSTGNSTGPHLHFEVHVNGTPVDPRLYL